MKTQVYKVLDNLFIIDNGTLCDKNTGAIIMLANVVIKDIILDIFGTEDALEPTMDWLLENGYHPNPDFWDTSETEAMMQKINSIIKSIRTNMNNFDVDNQINLENND